jgi:hypothetical protein
MWRNDKDLNNENQLEEAHMTKTIETTDKANVHHNTVTVNNIAKETGKVLKL